MGGKEDNLPGIRACAFVKRSLDEVQKRIRRSEERLQQVKEDTKVGGATLTKLLGTSAWYAPGAAVSSLVQAIACDQKKMFPCSTLLEGEYNLNDICIGVPIILGKNGIEKIVKLTLTDAEKEHMQTSAEGVRKTNGLLDV